MNLIKIRRVFFKNGGKKEEVLRLMKFSEDKKGEEKIIEELRADEGVQFLFHFMINEVDISDLLDYISVYQLVLGDVEGEEILREEEEEREIILCKEVTGEISIYNFRCRGRRWRRQVRGKEGRKVIKLKYGGIYGERLIRDSGKM